MGGGPSRRDGCACLPPGPSDPGGSVGSARRRRPLLVGITLIYVVGVRAVVTGIAESITAPRSRANIGSERLLVLAGSLSVVFGPLLWLWPLEAAQVVAFVIGVHVIVLGAVIAAARVRLRVATDLLTPEYDSEYEGRVEEGSTPKDESATGRRGPERRRGRHRAPKDGRSQDIDEVAFHGPRAVLSCGVHGATSDSYAKPESGRKGSSPGSGGPGGKRKSGAARAERAGAEEPTHELGGYRPRPESGPG